MKARADLKGGYRGLKPSMDTPPPFVFRRKNEKEWGSKKKKKRKEMSLLFICWLIHYL